MIKKFLTFTILILTLILASIPTSSTQIVYSQMDTLNRNHETLYLAGGCFWGTEHFLKLLNGVESTSVGYANSKVEEPTYKQVCTGETGAVEAVMVSFDPSVTSLEKVISLFFQTIDPTILNQQGNDKGTQYRTGIYTTNNEQLVEAKRVVDILANNYNSPLVIEIKPIENFYEGELYHQDYLEKNPDGYCHIGEQLFDLARKN